MKTRHLPLVAALLSAFALAQVQAQTATPAATPASAAAVAYSPANPGPGWYKHLVNLDFVKKQAAIPKIDGVMLIDSRPTARKYDIGHIPTAVNIPDTSFDKLAPTMLPKDKAMLLVFYCEGYDCILSHSSAAKAEALGYTNVRVFAEGFPGWVAGGNLPAVSVAYIKKLIDEKAPMTLIDARPKARKYDLGYIPTAINIPDSQFDSLAPKMLPADKTAPLVFLLRRSGLRAEQRLGAEGGQAGLHQCQGGARGLPGLGQGLWAGPDRSVAGAAPAAAKAPAIEAGKEAGSIAVASFERIFKEAPDSVFLIDVRDPKEFDNGSFKGAINMPLSTLEKNLDKLPTGKPIIFFCGAGARSGEAHDLVKLHKPEMKTVFLDADIKWTKDGAYTIKGK